VLVIEDHAPTLRAMVREIRGRFRPVPCRTIAGARRAVEQLRDAPAGVIVDVRLPDGNGLDLLSEIRELYPDAHVGALVVTGKADPEIINRSHLLDAGFAVKPDTLDNLRAFLDRIAAGRPRVPLEGAVERFVAEYALTPREADVVAALAHGQRRTDLADELGVDEGTVKSHIKHILKKTGDADTGELLARLLRGESKND